MLEDFKPTKLTAALGSLLVAVAPVLLLRSAFEDFRTNADVAWVHPDWSLAGFGFAGLALAFVAYAVWRYWSGRDANTVFAVMLLVLPAFFALSARRLTRSYAGYYGYTRCVTLDRFREGNVRRNDVTLQAYARRDSAAAAECAPR